MARFFKPQTKKKQPPEAIDLPLLIERYSDDGRGISHYQGKTVFVRNALKGERVQLRIEKTSARYIDAQASHIHTASAARAEPVCRYYGECGGCSLQHLNAEGQLALKQEQLLTQLQYQAGITPQHLLPPLSSQPYGYRQRCRLSVSYSKSGKVSMGFRKLNHKQVVDIKSCAVLHPSLDSLIPELRQWLDNLSGKPVSHIELVNEHQPLVLVRHTQTLSLAQRQPLVTGLQARGALCLFQGEKHGALKDEQGIAVETMSEYPLMDDVRVRFHPQGFIQANADVNRRMVQQALDWLAPKPNEVFLDLFCGAGNFALPLSTLAHKVLGFEGMESMVVQARANARLNSCDNLEFHHADLFADEFPSLAELVIDGLILDPPRAGAESVCRQIQQWNPKRLVYVSCNPTTFARDAQLLCKSGYRLKQAGLIDMYPQSGHSEVMGLFNR